MWDKETHLFLYKHNFGSQLILNNYTVKNNECTQKKVHKGEAL